MKKPERCQTCPWYGDGEGFVPDDVCHEPQVVFIAQNPGEVEETQEKPLVGVTGQMFKGRFVAKHLGAIKCGYMNVIKCRKQSADGKRSNRMPLIHSKEWREIQEHCQPYLEETLERVPESAVLVPMGEYAAHAVTGLKAKNMLHLRGTLLEGENE